MNIMNSLDLRGFVTTAVKEVFDTMLCMQVESVNGNADEVPGGRHIVGSVGFAGEVMGSLNIYITMEFANRLTAAMLGMEEDEIESDEDVHDVVGELCNMIGGDLKSRLCDSGFECSLSIPSITCGSDFTIETKGWDRSERYGFRNHKHTALVDVFIKSGS